MGERNKLWIFSLWSILHSPIFKFLKAKYSPQDPVFKYLCVIVRFKIDRERLCVEVHAPG